MSTFFLVMATLIVAGVVAGSFKHDSRSMQPALRVSGPRPRPQARSARSWQERSFAKALVLSPATGAPLLRPLSLKEDRSGDLLALDWSDAGVRRFTAAGQPRAAYHLPAGVRGGNPEDFDVDSGGNVWICYHDAGTVVELEPGGRPQQTWHLANSPHRILAPGAGRLVVFAADAGSNLFYRYSEQGEMLGGFGRLLEGDAQDPLTLDGDVARDGTGGFVYAALHTGLLASYTLDGALRFLVQTIDRVKLPTIVTATGASRKVAAGSPFAALTVSVAGDEIYVLVDAPAFQGSPSRALDVYSNRDGSYLYSFHAPEQTSFALVAGDHMYTIQDAVITRWRMQPAAAPMPPPGPRQALLDRSQAQPDRGKIEPDRGLRTELRR
ncbi:MAG TPA: hypothetical protein VH988_18385 [Thermoanaerobaculia bacterium]|nr:hypothetical protein [Thermoanaerobaculia bacterium]